MEPEMPAILPVLPNSVLTSIFNKVIRISNPGQLVKLSLACRSLREAVVRAEGLWERLCVKQGWSQRQRLPRPLPPLELAQPGHEEAGSSVGGGTATAGATATASAATPAAQSLPLSLSDLDLHWYLYYARRMMLRRDVRRLFKLYERFMSRPGSMALCPGASPEELAAAEQALGLAGGGGSGGGGSGGGGGGGGGGLPAEVWELYRHRSGQAPGAFVTFVDDMRLLGLHELAVEAAPGLPELQQRLAALGRQHSPQPQRPALPDAAAAAAVAAGPAAAGGEATASTAGTAALAESAAAVAPAAPARTRPGGDSQGAQQPEPHAAPAAAGGTAGGPGGAVQPTGLVPGDDTSGSGSGSGSGTGGGVVSPAGGGGALLAGARPQPDPLSDERVVAIAANASGSRRFLVAVGTGHVYIARGLSLAFYAPGVAALLQKLLT